MKSNLVHSHVTIQFDGVSPERVYEVYLSSKEHGAATGQSADIDARVGGKFSAYDEYLTGNILSLVPGKSIVQTWRSGHYKESDKDAILALRFRTNQFEVTEVEMVLINNPDDLERHDDSSWNFNYWEKFRTYLAKNPTSSKK
jgi:uncharacterized protein YndB with AHSA1/START domain